MLRRAGARGATSLLLVALAAGMTLCFFGGTERCETAPNPRPRQPPRRGQRARRGRSPSPGSAGSRGGRARRAARPRGAALAATVAGNVVAFVVCACRSRCPSATSGRMDWVILASSGCSRSGSRTSASPRGMRQARRARGHRCSCSSSRCSTRSGPGGSTASGPATWPTRGRRGDPRRRPPIHAAAVAAAEAAVMPDAAESPRRAHRVPRDLDVRGRRGVPRAPARSPLLSLESSAVGRGPGRCRSRRRGPAGGDARRRRAGVGQAGRVRDGEHPRGRGGGEGGGAAPAPARAASATSRTSARAPRRCSSHRTTTPTGTSASAGRRRTGPAERPADRRRAAERDGPRPQPRLREAREPRGAGARRGRLRPLGPAPHDRLPRDRRLVPRLRAHVVASAHAERTAGAQALRARAAAPRGASASCGRRACTRSTTATSSDPQDPAKGWRTFDHRPRFGNSVLGLRNRLCVLSEAYVYDDFRRRIESTEAFLVALLEHVAEDGAAAMAACAAADARSQVGQEIAVRSDFAPAVGLEVLARDAPIGPDRARPGARRGRVQSRRAPCRARSNGPGALARACSPTSAAPRDPRRERAARRAPWTSSPIAS